MTPTSPVTLSRARKRRDITQGVALRIARRVKQDHIPASAPSGGACAACDEAWPCSAAIMARGVLSANAEVAPSPPNLSLAAAAVVAAWDAKHIEVQTVEGFAPMDTLRVAIEDEAASRAVTETPEGLDVERLANVMRSRYGDEGWHLVLMSADGGVVPAQLSKAFIEAVATAYDAGLTAHKDEHGG